MLGERSGEGSTPGFSVPVKYLNIIAISIDKLIKKWYLLKLQENIFDKRLRKEAVEKNPAFARQKPKKKTG